MEVEKNNACLIHSKKNINLRKKTVMFHCQASFARDVNRHPAPVRLPRRANLDKQNSQKILGMYEKQKEQPKLTPTNQTQLVTNRLESLMFYHYTLCKSIWPKYNISPT